MMNDIGAPYFRKQQEIIQTLGVRAVLDIKAEIDKRIAFMRTQLLASRRKSLVLGISGGVDSTTAGILAQRAADQIREAGGDAVFIAMRLPYGTQADEDDAQSALALIAPDIVMTVDIKPASDAMLQALKDDGVAFDSAAHEDFVMGNIKARQRMIAQYALAGTYSGLVIGTDQAAEALMGFFTKYGDGAADIMPLASLTKRQVRAMAAYCGAPDALVNKVPTADLETLAPLKPDEAAFGIGYEEIDDFLEGKPVSQQAYEIIFQHYQQTEHKRRLPLTPLMPLSGAVAGEKHHYENA